MQFERIWNQTWALMLPPPRHQNHHRYPYSNSLTNKKANRNAVCFSLSSFCLSFALLLLPCPIFSLCIFSDSTRLNSSSSTRTAVVIKYTDSDWLTHSCRPFFQIYTLLLYCAACCCHRHNNNSQHKTSRFPPFLYLPFSHAFFHIFLSTSLDLLNSTWHK